MGAFRRSAIGGLLWAACALSGGCHLISGLGDLTVGDTSTASAGGGGTGGTGGVGGSTGGGGTGGDGGTTTTSSSQCADGDKNGAETDVDCGGPDCEKRCAKGRACLVSPDCESGICREGICTGVAQIAAGNAHVCAVLETGELFCWGENTSGQLGVGDSMARTAPALVDLADVVEVSAGGLPGDKSVAHTCARTSTNQVRCWGANDSGQLGTGNTDPQATPALVSTLSGVKGIAAGGAFTCAIQSDSGVACWGANDAAQLAADVGATSSSPATSPDLAGVTALVAGATHGCALLATGGARCWGSNGSGQVGNESATDPAKPIDVNVVSGVSLLGAGLDATCALDSTGLLCWGDNADSQLTGAVMEASTSTPTPLRLTGVLAFALGADGDDADANSPAGGHACAIHMGKLSCWGNNRKGQLGRASVSDKEPTPAEIAGLDGVVGVALGAEISCARLATGGVKCWGRNDLGQLGAGMAGGSQSSPVPVAWP